MPKDLRSDIDKSEKQRGAATRDSESRRSDSRVKESDEKRQAGQLEKKERSDSSGMDKRSDSRL